jgi:hypothetical protein
VGARVAVVGCDDVLALSRVATTGLVNPSQPEGMNSGT